MKEKGKEEKFYFMSGCRSFLFFFFSKDGACGEEDGLRFGFRESVVAVFARAFTLCGHLEIVCLCVFSHISLYAILFKGVSCDLIINITML